MGAFDGLRAVGCLSSPSLAKLRGDGCIIVESPEKLAGGWGGGGVFLLGCMRGWPWVSSPGPSSSERCPNECMMMGAGCALGAGFRHPHSNLVRSEDATMGIRRRVVPSF